MTTRRVWLGSTGPFLYDDSVLYIDEDGVISPDNQQAIATDGQIVVQSPPTSPVHVVRKYELDNLVATLGLGTMAFQNANAVSITGGTVNDLTALESSLTILTGFFQSAGMRVPNIAGNDVVALYSEITAEGGTNRWGVYHNSTAPSFFGGPLYVMGVMNLSSTLDVNGAIYTAARIGVQIAPTGGFDLYMGHTKPNYAIVVHAINSDAAGYALTMTNTAGAVVGSVTYTGATTAYNTTSDVRLKRDVKPLAGALDVLRALNPVSFLWNADGSPGHGFLAHEVANIVPDAITGEPDAVDEEGRILPQQMDHSKLVPWLTAAMQELVQQVKDLTARVSELEAA